MSRWTSPRAGSPPPPSPTPLSSRSAIWRGERGHPDQVHWNRRQHPLGRRGARERERRALYSAPLTRRIRRGLENAWAGQPRGCRPAFVNIKGNCDEVHSPRQVIRQHDRRSRSRAAPGSGPCMALFFEASRRAVGVRGTAGGTGGERVGYRRRRRPRRPLIQRWSSDQELQRLRDALLHPDPRNCLPRCTCTP